MKYRYTSFFPPDKNLKWIKRPIVEVEIFGPKGSKKFGALVDSGADCSLFNIQVAELLGIDLSKAKPRNFIGIIGTVNAYFLEDIEIKVESMENTVKIPVSFIDSETVGVILGQEGFFDQYRVKFEKDHDTFEVNPIKR